MDFFAEKRKAYDTKFATESNVANLLSAWRKGLTPEKFETRERIGVTAVYSQGSRETGAAAARRLEKVDPRLYQSVLNEMRTRNRKQSIKSIGTIATIAVGGYFAGSAMAAGNAASVGTAATAAPVSSSAGIGLSAQAGLPAYQTQLAAATATKSAISAGSVVSTVKAGAGALSAVASGVSGVTGLVSQLRGAANSGNVAPITESAPVPAQMSVGAPGDSPDISIDAGGGSDMGAFLPVAIFGLAAVLLLKGKF